MKLIGFRTPKPRKYSYKPIFYDPVKDEQADRKRELYRNTDNVVDSELRLRMRMRMNRKASEEKLKRRSRITGILFSLLLLIMIVYYIFIK